MKLPGLFLASQSPRRLQLLQALGLQCQVILPSSEEVTPDPHRVEEVTQENAFAKVSSVLSRLAKPTDVAIGADTLVISSGQVLGKPTDAESVKVMLKNLSGRTHDVVTGIVLLSSYYGCRRAAVNSKVRFRELSTYDIEQYALTREPYDKAGAYAVQGMGSLFIEKIEGSYTNVMGLPIEQFLISLSELTQIPTYQWFE